MTTRTPRIIPGFTAQQSASLFALGVVRDDDIARLGDRDATSEIQTEDMIARPGQFLRAQPLAPRGMALLLPPPDSTEPGARVTVSLESPGAPLRVSCVPSQESSSGATLGTVNGELRASFTVSGLLEFTSNGASQWTTPAEHPAESAAITIASVTAIAAAVPVSTWAQVLRAGLNTGGRTPRIDAGDALAFASGATGITAAGDLLIDGAGTIELESATDMHLHAGGELHLGHEDLTTFIHQGAIGTIELVAGGDYTCQAAGDVTMSAAGFWQVTTGAVNRLQIDTTGAWLLFGDSGTANDVLTSQGPGTPPLWVDPTTLVPTPSWSGVLGVGATSGTNNPIVDVGQFMQFGLVGPTTSSPQIRSGDAFFRIGCTGGFVTSAASVSMSATAGNMLLSASGIAALASSGAASVQGSSVSWNTSSTPRVVIGSTGEWTTPAGTSGLAWVHQGAGPPIWASVGNSGLANMAAGTQKGRQIDSGAAGSPVDLTGAEQGENIRFGTRQDSSLTGTQNNFALADDTTELVMTGTTVTLTGFAINSVASVGKAFLLRAGGSTTITLASQTGSTATQQISCPGDRNLVLPPRSAAWIYYSDALWRVGDFAKDWTALETTTAGPHDDLAIGDAQDLMFSNAAGTLNGIDGTSTHKGKFVAISHQGSGFTDIVDAAGTSSAGSRFNQVQNATLRLVDDEVALFCRLDITAGATTDNRWLCVSHRPPFANTAANVAGNMLRHDGTDWAVVGTPGLLKRDEVVTNTNWTSTCPAGATAFRLRTGGAGGGGGGCDAETAFETCAGGGGGSGAEIDIFVSTIDDTTSVTGTTGAAGTAGSATGGTGGTGAASTANYNSVTYTANGGVGGVGTAAGAIGAAGTNLMAATAGGIGGTTTETQASFNGSAGDPGLMFSNNAAVAQCMAIGGRGGPSSRHGGGSGAIQVGAAGGPNGTGGSQGSGGGGAARIVSATAASTGTTGGQGGTGWAIIEWYGGPAPK
jgi:hypothetical protein